MSTQWSTSFGGYVGLKYEVLLLQGGLFDLYQVKDREEMLEEMKSSDYENLIKVFDDNFGSIVTLYR